MSEPVGPYKVVDGMVRYGTKVMPNPPRNLDGFCRVLNLAHSTARVELDAVLGECREALRQIADSKLCDDEGEAQHCSLDSGPYCGCHAFDEEPVLIARAALAKLGAVHSKPS